MAGADVRVLVGVAKTAAQGGNTPALMKQELNEIIDGLNSKNALHKIKVVVDEKALKANLSTAMRTVINDIAKESESGKFPKVKVGVSQSSFQQAMKQMIDSYNKGEFGKNIVLKVRRINAADAIAKFRTELETMLKNLTVSSGFVVKVDKNGAKSATMQKDFSPELLLSERNRTAAQVKTLTQMAKVLEGTFKTAIPGSKRGLSAEQFDQVRNQYEMLISEISVATQVDKNGKIISDENLRSIQDRTVALHQNILAMQEATHAAKSSVDASKNTTAAEKEETKVIDLENASYQGLASTLEKVREKAVEASEAGKLAKKETVGTILSGTSNSVSGKSTGKAGSSIHGLVTAARKNEAQLDSAEKAAVRLEGRYIGFLQSIDQKAGSYKEGTFAELRQEIEGTIKLFDGLDNSSGTLVNEVDTLSRKLDELQTRFKKLQLSGEKAVKAPGQAIGPSESELNAAESRATRLEGSYAKLRMAIDKTSPKYAKGTFDELQNEVLETEKTFATLDKTSDTYINDVEQLSTKLDQLRTQFAKLMAGGEAATEMPSEKSMQRAADTAEKLRGDLARLQADTKSASQKYVGTDDFTSLENKIRGARERLKELEGALKSGSVTADQYVKDVEDIRSEMIKLKSDLEELKSGGTLDDLGGRAFASDSSAGVRRLSNASALLGTLRTRSGWTAAARDPRTVSDYRVIRDNIKPLSDLIELARKGDITFGEFDERVRQIEQSTAGASARIRSFGLNASSVGDRLRSAASKFSSWLGVSQIIMLAIRSVRQMVSQVIELDSSMTQLRIVTKASNAEMEDYGETAAKTAQRIGSSITDLNESATVYARLGYSIKESGAMAEYTAMLKNVGNIDVADAQNAMTAIIKAFGKDVDELESIMDKMVVVGNTTPISVAEIAEGMNNAGSALSAADNTFEESIALLTAANTTVQNISKSSTGLRTIAARIRNVKTELDDLGETMTTAEYDELVKALTGEGVSLTDANGQLRSTYDILRDIAKVWDTMDPNKRASLAETLSGTRQQNVFFSIVEQFQEAEKAMAAMGGSAGELRIAYSKYLDSIEGHIGKFRATFQNLGKDLINSDTIKFFVDAGRTILQFLDVVVKLGNGLGGLGSLLRTVGMVFAATKITKLLEGASVTGQAVVVTLKALRTGFITTNASGNVFAVGAAKISGALKSIGISASTAQVAVAGIVVLLSVAITAYQKHQEKLKKLHDEAVAATQEMKSFTEEYANAYNVLNSEKSTREQMNEVLKSTVDKYDEEAEKLSTVNDLRESGIRLLDEEAKKRAQEYVTENTGEFFKANDFLTGAYKVSSFGESMSAVRKNPYVALASIASEIERLRQKGEEKNLSWFDTKYLDDLEAEYGDLKKKIEEYEEVTTQYINAKNILNGTFEIEGAHIDDVTRKYISMNPVLSDVTAGTGSQEQTIKDLADAHKALAASLSVDAIEGYIEATEKYGAESYEALNAMAALEAVLPGLASMMYDLSTGSLKVADGFITDKNSLLDFYEAQRLVKMIPDVAFNPIPGMEGVFGNVAIATSAFFDPKTMELGAKLRQQIDSLREYMNGTAADEAVETVRNVNASIDGIVHELMMMEKLGGTVDMINRRVIEINDKNYEIAKTWGFNEDSIGSVMTLASQTFQDGNTAIVVTPILPNGKLLTQDELEKYVDGLIDKATDGNYAKHDTLGLIMGVFADGSTWDENLQKSDQFAIRAHELHEQLIDLAGSLGNANMEGANLYDLLSYLSEKATGVDKALEGVTNALNDYGDGTIEVYDAMVALETELNGSTNDLYDFETATLKVDSSLISSKESLIDFIDTNRQISFSTAISELEKLETSFWSVAGSIMASKEAAVQMARVLSFTTGGNVSVEETTIPGMKNGAISERLEKLREEKASWDQWIGSLRQRSDYKPKETGNENEGSNAAEADLELERLKSIVSLRKEELGFIEASGGSVDDQVAKMREIQSSLHDQANHMRGVLSTMIAQNASKAEINAQAESILSLSTEWWKVQNDINELLHDDVDTLSAYKDRIGLLKAELDFMEARGDADSERITKMREIQSALHEEAEAIRATEAYTNGEASALQSVVELGTEWWNIQNKIKELSADTLDDEKELLENMKSGTEKILSLVIELIKQQKEDEIQALEDQKNAYREIVDLQKKSLQQTKSETSYQKTVKKQLEEMAELQRRINALDMDDSREAKTEKAKLIKDLSEMQEDLSETQADYALEAQEDSLDKMADAFEKEKDGEIQTVRDSISSYQKLYDLAISYIGDHWETLYDELIGYNESYGSELNSTITTAWENALQAAQRYGSFVNSIGGIQSDLSTLEEGGTLPKRSIHDIVSEMEANSVKWQQGYAAARAAGAEESSLKQHLNELYHTKNEDLAAILRGDPYNLDIEYDNGVYYVVENGVRKKLYDTYHTGGIVEGQPSTKQNEVLALLKNGETVLTEQQGKTMYRIVDYFAYLSQKLGASLTGDRVSRVLSGYRAPVKNQTFASPLPSASGGGNTIVEKLEVSAPIYVSEKLDEEDIRKHARAIGAMAADYIREGFTKRNITGPVFGM